jgi:hypothetical protein
MRCTTCGVGLRPGAAFCDSCGEAVRHDPQPLSRPNSRARFAWSAGGVFAGLAVVAAGFFFLSGGDSEDPAPPAPDAGSVARVQATLDSLPGLEGATDLEQTRSLLGPPDAFTIFLDQYPDGSTARREEWFYYELYSLYEFVDGRLVANLPLDDPADWQVFPRQYDPAMFELGETWVQVAERIPEPGSLTRFELEPEYELQASYYVGNQLLLLFDDLGGLLYVEAIPLEPGEELAP